MGFFSVRQKSARCGRTFCGGCFLMLGRLLPLPGAADAAASAVFQPVLSGRPESEVLSGIWVRPPMAVAMAEVLALLPGGGPWGRRLTPGSRPPVRPLPAPPPPPPPGSSPALEGDR